MHYKPQLPDGACIVASGEKKDEPIAAKVVAVYRGSCAGTAATAARHLHLMVTTHRSTANISIEEYHAEEVAMPGGGAGGGTGGGRGGGKGGGPILPIVEKRLAELCIARIGEFERSGKSVRRFLPVMLVYGRPECPAMKDAILPSLSYLHQRSGSLFEFILMGYDSIHQETSNSSVLDDADAAIYRPDQFAESVAELEDLTDWRYSGQTDVVFLVGTLRVERGDPIFKFDFSSSVSLTLETAVADKLLNAATTIFELATRASAADSPSQIVRQLSGKLVSRSAKDGIIKWLAGLLKIDATALRNVGTGVVIDLRRAPISTSNAKWQSGVVTKSQASLPKNGEAQAEMTEVALVIRYEDGQLTKPRTQ